MYSIGSNWIFEALIKYCYRSVLSMRSAKLGLLLSALVLYVTVVTVALYRYLDGLELRLLVLNPAFYLDTNVSEFCVDDCRAFQRRLQRWPTDRPKAAIYFLVGSHRGSLSNLVDALASVDQHFNDRFQYPVIIFHEADLYDVSNRSQVRAMTRSTVYFEEVRFELPAFVNRSAVPKVVCYRGVGYRHMCRSAIV